MATSCPPRAPATRPSRCSASPASRRTSSTRPCSAWTRSSSRPTGSETKAGACCATSARSCVRYCLSDLVAGGRVTASVEGGPAEGAVPDPVAHGGQVNALPDDLRLRDASAGGDLLDQRKILTVGMDV